MRRLAAALALILLAARPGASIAAGPPDEQQCRYPNPYAVIGPVAGLGKVEYLPVTNWLQRWLLVSREGPLDGTVYVIACDGKVIAQRQIGYIDRAQNGPTIARQNTLEIYYVPATGTGIDLQSVALLHFDGKLISVVWDHPVKEQSTFSNDMMGGARGDYRDRTEARTFDWALSPSGMEISVTGHRTTELGGKVTRAGLPAEKYCYQPGPHRFQKCR